MSKKNRTISYLSGATFFSLLAEARRESVAQYQILTELAKIFNDKEDFPFEGSGATQQTSKYKSGSNPAPGFMNFYDQKSISAFEERIKKNPSKVLNRINEFIEEYLYVDGSDTWLIQALFDVISNDNGVDETAVLFEDIEGKDIHKSDLKGCKEISIPAVLLGIWKYTLCHKDDKEKVKKAYAEWTTIEHDGSRSVVRQLFSWNVPLIVQEYISTESGEEEPEEIALVVDNTSIYEKFLKTNVQESVHLPNYKKVNPIDIVIEQGGLSRALTPYGVYMESIQKKHEKVFNFLYKAERPMQSFYVSNDLELYLRGGSVTQTILEQYETITDLQVDKLPLSECGYIVITAEGGMGKSMAMHHLTVSCVKKYDSLKKIPIFITARLYSKHEGTFVDFILSEFQRHNPELKRENLLNLITHGQAILLIDGLDEIAVDRIGQFFDDLELFMDQYEKTFIIVSTRRHVTSRILSKYVIYNLKPLNYDQAIEVIKKVDDKSLREGVTQEFIEDLENKRSGLDWDKQQEFLGNPLLLNIMLLTYAENHVISSKRYLFYEDAYNALASKHDVTKGLTRDFRCGLDIRDFQLLFGEFCATAYDKDIYDFQEDAMHDYLDEVIRANNYSISADLVIADITEKLCLMFKEGDEYHFIHKTFMEYFAAYFFSKQDAMYYDAIYKIFQMYDESRHDDETLGMLYGMAPQQVERHIVYPYLKEIIERRFTYEGEQPKDTYSEFINWIYPCIYFYEGECACENLYEDSNSAIYNFIRKQYGIEIPPEIEPPEGMPPSYEIYHFYYVPENWQNPDDPGESVLLEKEDIDPEFFELYPSAEQVGVLYEVSTIHLGTDIEKNKSILEYVYSEDFCLYREYKEVKKLYIKLRDKYEEKKEADVGQSFTSRFH